MGADGRQLTGWKAIAAYLGRDRSTVIRWAQTRALPVRYLPGGGAKRTVFALTDELDGWARGGLPDADPAPAEAEPAAPRRARLPWLVAAGLALIVAAATLSLWLLRPATATVAALPRDPKVAALYIQGRDHWAQRDAPGLTKAIAELEAVTRADPAFAPAFSALADAYLLSREFGSMPDAVAFDRARAAAERARAIDPALAAAHRAIGFVAYWREHDRPLAGSAFRRALSLDPDDGQTHFWYGNVLVDNGEHKAAQRELDAARLALPGSLAIETDYAWALWSAGETGPAFARLEAIVARSPNFAVAHDCLAEMHLAERRYADYLRELRARQQARAEPGLARKVRTYEQAIRSGGAAALHAALLATALREEEGAPFPDHSFAAFIASVGRDRPALLTILRLADRHHEIWGSAGFVRRIAGTWPNDPEIRRLLARRTPPAIETT